MSNPEPAPLPNPERLPWPPETSARQRGWDLAGGIVAPVVCLIFDPIVFRGNLATCSPPMLGFFTVFAYTAIGLGTTTLAVWLIAPRYLAPVCEVVAGVFLGGVLAAALLGVVLLPFSVLGLLAAGLGLLGFTPFWAARAYWRNCRQAWRAAKARAPARPRRLRLGLATLGLAATILLPALAQSQAAWLAPATVSLPPGCTSPYAGNNE